MATDPPTTPLTAYPAKPLQWLWHPRIPLGKLTLLAADPGLGKTALALHLAAALSNGASPCPQMNNEQCTLDNPRSTLLLSPHDSTTDTLRPRLDAMNANPDHIHLLPTFHSLTPNRLTTDHYPLTTLENACRSIPNLALLVIDPITHFLGLTDKAASPDTRSTLHALSQLAENLNIAILLTTRLTKKLPPLSAPSLPALHRTLGSLAFATAARTTLLLLPYTPPPSSPPLETRNPKLETPNRLLLTLKSNLTALPAPLPFTLAQTLTFHKELDPAAFAPKPPPTIPDKESFLADACAFLQRYLADGPQKAAGLQAAATQNGITPTTLRRAKIALDIQTRFDGPRHAWFWCLKGDLRRIPTIMEDIEKSMSTLRTLPSLESILSEGDDL